MPDQQQKTPAVMTGVKNWFAKTAPSRREGLGSGKKRIRVVTATSKAVVAVASR